MRNKEEILKELQYRCKFVISQSESYSGYRANMNFVRGMLFCLGFDFPAHYNLSTLLKQFESKKEKFGDFDILEIKKVKKNYFKQPKTIPKEQVQALKELIK